MRVDLTQQDIVHALRQMGVRVWIIGQPCDLLTLYRGRWLPLECKSTRRVRKDQAGQNAFVEENGVPRVTSVTEALKAVGVAQ